MLNTNSGLMSKVIVGKSFYLTLHAFIRPIVDTFVWSKSFFYHCKKKTGDMWRHVEARAQSKFWLAFTSSTILLSIFSLSWTVEVFKKPDLWTCTLVSTPQNCLALLVLEILEEQYAVIYSKILFLQRLGCLPSWRWHVIFFNKRKRV